MDFNKAIEALKDELISSTQEVIRIKSVEDDPQKGMPFGKGPYDALCYVLDLGEKLGFKAKNLDGYAGHLDFGEGEEVVGVLGHLDVVPEGDGWTFPPYGAEIHDGKIYGRGSMDDKGPVMAALYSMKALKDSGVKLNKKIRLILGTNEETGWGCMHHYFANETPPNMAFTPDADFPVIHGEKGIIVFDLKYKLDSLEDESFSLLSLKGGNAANMVPDYAEAIIKVDSIDKSIDALRRYANEKGYQADIKEDNGNLKVSVKGKSAHGSTPEKGENAITYLLNLLYSHFNGESSIYNFLDWYEKSLAFKYNGENFGCEFEDELSGKLNLNVGVIKLVGEEIILSINIRYPISYKRKDVYDSIRTHLKGLPIEIIEGNSDKDPLYVPKDDILVQTLMKVYQEQTGDYEAEPLVIGGGTYARAMKNAVAFGPVFPGQEELAHQKDEFISIDNLVKLTQIYTHALYELAK
jgi:succinyl-diaminopimelate desuccinylase